MRLSVIGAALGPLLAGLISPTGWNNVFYMLISADVLACLVRVLGPHRCWSGNAFCGQFGAPAENTGASGRLRRAAALGSASPPPVRNAAQGTSQPLWHVPAEPGTHRVFPSLSTSDPPQLLCRLVYKEILAWKTRSRNSG